MHPLDHIDVLLHRKVDSLSVIQETVQSAAATKIGRIELASIAAGIAGDTDATRQLRSLIQHFLDDFGESSGGASVWRDERTPRPHDSIILDGEVLDAQSSAKRNDFGLSFRDNLRRVGVQAGGSDVIVAAAHELMSNALEHAQSRSLPVAAYEVSPSRWRFCATDTGRGFRASLGDNPAYARLRNDSDALREALKPGVSRTRIPGRGQGFSYVFRALVDRDASIRIRTGTIAANWSGRGIADSLLKFLTVGQRPGLHIEIGATV